MASEARLTPDGGVVPRTEMLAYCRVRSAFSPRDALPSGVIRASRGILPSGLQNELGVLAFGYAKQRNRSNI
jgi:hypothetical protein